jgi:hypothetical protein
MQPLPTSSHSWTCSPPLLMVKDFSISEADFINHYEHMITVDTSSNIQSPNSVDTRQSQHFSTAYNTYHLI